jgi:hypothetical protein
VVNLLKRGWKGVSVRILSHFLLADRKNPTPDEAAELKRVLSKVNYPEQKNSMKTIRSLMKESAMVLEKILECCVSSMFFFFFFFRFFLFFFLFLSFSSLIFSCK